MKVLLISFAVGSLFGFLYGLIRVKSPAPPIVALLGLLGMVLGEQLGNAVITKKANVAHAVSICLTGKCWGGPATANHMAGDRVMDARPAQKSMGGDSD